MKSKTIFWIGLLILILWQGARALGMIVEVKLSEKLTKVFNMPVQVEGLYVNPFTGYISARWVKFDNQPEYRPGPHMLAENLRTTIDMRALFDKKLLFSNTRVKPYYYLEHHTVPTELGAKNNANQWWRFIKKNRKKKKKDPNAKKWEVRFDIIHVKEGVFIYHKYNPEGELLKRYDLRNLEGSLEGLGWPAEPPEVMTQELKVKGDFGHLMPAYFEVEGIANFSVKYVSFDLHGEIPNGAVQGFPQYYEELPIQVHGGNFELISDVLCVKWELESQNELVLKDVKVTPGPKASDKIWGVPMTAFAGFLQNKDYVSLEIIVNGNIIDPKFEYNQAFNKAFQESLKERTMSGIQFFTDGPEKLARKTGEVFSGGLEKITNIGRSTDEQTEEQMDLKSESESESQAAVEVETEAKEEVAA